ncbi:MAG: class I SAM-dependent methyltransferase [Solirubrobacteraceae bacterium]|nr:class I SAM-dependent methyltransferase [Solirubrobacteraceae bacterium]
MLAHKLLRVPDSPPLPPAELAAYVWGGNPPADWQDAFDAGGKLLRDQLEAIVPGALHGGARILDFGCGSGRLLRQLLPQATAGEVHGTDIDAESVAWIQGNLCPPCQATVAPSAPPLEYQDESFDLIVAVSVFSQIADGWAEWLLELRRILKPGGLLVVSLMGLDRAPIIAGRDLTDAEVGMSIHGYGRPWAAGGPMILHSEWWVRAHYGRAFTVRSVHPRALNDLDTYVLKRPVFGGEDAGNAGGAGAPGAAAAETGGDDHVPTPAELAAPEPGEPRELSAAMHDVARLHQDHATLNAAHDAYAAAYQEESAKSAELRAALEAAKVGESPSRGRRFRR